LDPTPTEITDGEEWRDSDIILFPIPTAGFLELSLNNETIKNKTLSFHLTNLLGQQIMSDKINIESRSALIDLRNFEDGIYYLSIYADSKKFYPKKVILLKK
jgi:hypothetical protein